MSGRLAVSLILSTVLFACSILAFPQASTNSNQREELKDIVGRWALIATLVDGDDTTKGGLTQNGTIRYYTFKPDHTFSITFGGETMETGTWSSNASASPKTFDHTPTSSPWQKSFS